MAWIAMREKRKQSLPKVLSDDKMVVKSLSIPIGLESLMESLTREVLKMQPKDIYTFASEHFAKLVRIRDADEYAKMKTIPEIRKQNVSSAPTKNAVPPEIPKNITLPVPKLDLSNINSKSISPVIKLNRSEASTAEIDKIDANIFGINNKPERGEDSKTEDETNVETPTNSSVIDINAISPKSAIEMYGDGAEDKIDSPNAMENKAKQPEADSQEGNVSIQVDDTNVKNLATSLESQSSERTDTEPEKIDEHMNADSGGDKTDNVDERADNSIQINKEDKEDNNNKVIAAVETTVCDNNYNNAMSTLEENLPSNLTESENSNGICVSKIEIDENMEKISHDNAESVQDSQDLETNTDTEGGNINKPIENDITVDRVVDDIGQESFISDNVTSETKLDKDIEISSEQNAIEATETEGSNNDASEIEATNDINDLALIEILDNSTSTIQNKELSTDTITSDSDTTVRYNESETVNKLLQRDESKVMTETYSKPDEPTIGEYIQDKQIIPDIPTEDDTNVAVENSETKIEEEEPPEETHSIKKRSLSSSDEIQIQLDDSSEKNNRNDMVNMVQVTRAAVKIQTCWRSYLHKKASADQNGKIATKGKDIDEMVNVIQATRAAVRIQTCWRSYLDKKKASADQSGGIVTKAQDGMVNVVQAKRAAIKIQRCWRTYSDKKKSNSGTDNPIESSTNQLNVIAVDSKDQLIKAEEMSNVVKAAIRIQTCWRFYLNRMKSNIEKEVVDVLIDDEMIMKSTNIEDMFDIVQATKAAMKIQSCWRTYLDKKTANDTTKGDETEMQLMNTNEMANVVQATRAATKIQSCWRSYLKNKSNIQLEISNGTDMKESMGDIVQATRAAIKIQSFWRTYIDKKNSINPNISQQDHKRDFIIENENISTTTDVDNFITITRAAIKIQSNWRKYLHGKKQNNNNDQEKNENVTEAVIETNNENDSIEPTVVKTIVKSLDGLAIPNKSFDNLALIIDNIAENSENNTVLESSEYTDRKSSLENSVTEEFTTIKKMIDEINTSGETKSEDIFDTTDVPDNPMKLEDSTEARKDSTEVDKEADKLEEVGEQSDTVSEMPDLSPTSNSKARVLKKTLTIIDTKIDDLDNQINDTLLNILEQPVNPDPAVTNEIQIAVDEQSCKTVTTLLDPPVSLEISKVNSSDASDKIEDEEEIIAKPDLSTVGDQVEMVELIGKGDTREDMKDVVGDFKLTDKGCSLQMTDVQTDASQLLEQLEDIQRRDGCDELPEQDSIYQLTKLTNAAITIQRLVRGYLSRKRVKPSVDSEMSELDNLEKAAVTIQRVTRGHLARKRIETNKNTSVMDLDNSIKAAMTIQRAVRRYLARRAIKKQSDTQIADIQTLTHAATTIQRFVRAYVARKNAARNSINILKAAVTIQKAARVYLAKKQVEKLRFVSRNATLVSTPSKQSMTNADIRELEGDNVLENKDALIINSSTETKDDSTISNDITRNATQTLKPSEPQDEVDELNERLANISKQPSRETDKPISIEEDDESEDLKTLKERLQQMKTNVSGDSLTTVHSAEYAIALETEEENTESSDITELNNRLAQVKPRVETLDDAKSEVETADNHEEITDLDKRLAQIKRSTSHEDMIVTVDATTEKDCEDIDELNARLSQIKADTKSIDQIESAVATEIEDDKEVLELTKRLANLKQDSYASAINNIIIKPNLSESETDEIDALNQRLSKITKATEEFPQERDVSTHDEDLQEVVELNERLALINAKTKELTPEEILLKADLIDLSNLASDVMDSVTKKQQFCRSYSMRLSSEDNQNASKVLDQSTMNVTEQDKLKPTEDNYPENVYSSPKYDFKPTPKNSKTSSPNKVTELTTAAYIISAGIAAPVDDIVNAISPEEIKEDKAVEYIIIPLKSDGVTQLQAIVPKPNQKLTKTPKPDGSVEYIYIPLKDPDAKQADEEMSPGSVSKPQTPEARKALYDEVDAIINTYGRKKSPVPNSKDQASENGRDATFSGSTEVDEQNKSTENRKSPRVVYETSFNTNSVKKETSEDDKPAMDVVDESPLNTTLDSGESISNNASDVNINESKNGYIADSSNQTSATLNSTVSDPQNVSEIIESLTDEDVIDVNIFKKHTNVHVSDETLEEMLKKDQAIYVQDDTESLEEFLENLTNEPDPNGVTMKPESRNLKLFGDGAVRPRNDATASAETRTDQTKQNDGTFADASQRRSDVLQGRSTSKTDSGNDPEGLQHSGEMHDSIEIFVSGEELSQGATMVTSQLPPS